MLRLVLEAVNGGVRKLSLDDRDGLEGGVWRVGRSADGDAVLRWPEVSKHHARLLAEHGDLWLVPGLMVQIGLRFLSLDEVGTGEVEIGLIGRAGNPESPCIR